MSTTPADDIALKQKSWLGREPSALARKDTIIATEILETFGSVCITDTTKPKGTYSYTFAYIELFAAARKPRNCNTAALAPLMNISVKAPPNAVVQMIDAQINANMHRIHTGYNGGALRTCLSLVAP